MPLAVSVELLPSRSYQSVVSFSLDVIDLAFSSRITRLGPLLIGIRFRLTSEAGLNFILGIIRRS
jgi:hypothetical protein